MTLPLHHIPIIVLIDGLPDGKICRCAISFDAWFPRSAGVAHARQRISLILVNGNPLGRERVASLIRVQPGFHVLTPSAGTKEILRQVRATRPDVVLLNLGQAGEDRLALASALHRAVPKSRVIIMGLKAPQKDVVSFVRAGVSGFIMADASLEQFLQTVRSVVQGLRALPAELTRSLFGQLKRHGVWGRPKRSPSIRRLPRLPGNRRLEIVAFSPLAVDPAKIPRPPHGPGPSLVPVVPLDSIKFQPFD
ncbi:MAG TPA: response regulator [Gemmatimonadales bacterium]|nr:response regulator [Gemmatimonadales bacterium]